MNCSLKSSNSPAYTLTEPRPGIWSFQFAWRDHKATFTLAHDGPNPPTVWLTRMDAIGRGGATFACRPDWEPAASVMAAMIADAWDTNRLTHPSNRL